MPESPQEAADSASAWDEVLSFLSSPNTSTATVKALFDRGGVSISQLVEGMNGMGIEVSDDQREAFKRSETTEKGGEVSFIRRSLLYKYFILNVKLISKSILEVHCIQCYQR